MSKQRLRLAKYLNKRQIYRATFSEIRHDDHDQPQVLLKNVYPVYANGRKIPLRSRYVLTDEKGQQIAASHLWTNLNVNFLKVTHELLYGDQIQFSAVVTTYPIVRENVVKTRKQLWQQNKQDQKRMYKQYQLQLSEMYDTANEAKSKAYHAYRKHLLTFDEMKDAQNIATKELQRNRTRALNSFKRKAKNHTKRTQKQISNVSLVDYTLSEVQDVTLTKANKHFKPNMRCKYDETRLNDVRYTKFLAAHSMYARQGRLREWGQDNRKEQMPL